LIGMAAARDDFLPPNRMNQSDAVELTPEVVSELISLRDELQQQEKPTFESFIYGLLSSARFRDDPTAKYILEGIQHQRLVILKARRRVMEYIESAKKRDVFRNQLCPLELNDRETMITHISNDAVESSRR